MNETTTAPLSPAVRTLVLLLAAKAKSANRWLDDESAKARIWLAVDGPEEYEAAIRLYLETVKM